MVVCRDAALAELAGVGPRTVVWLNEAQFYLDAEDELGERVAAGLRELLRDPARAPVLVLATLWPGFWDALTARPAGRDDRHAQARATDTSLGGRWCSSPEWWRCRACWRSCSARMVRWRRSIRRRPRADRVR